MATSVPRGSAELLDSGAFARLGRRITRTGMLLTHAALAIIYFWFGGMKFTLYEANGIQGLVANSPLLSWMYGFMDVMAFSRFLGVLEITVGLLIAARCIAPAASALGGFLSMGLFATTVSFMVTTPGVFEPSLGFPAISAGVGQFLLKDIGLFAASVLVLGDSLTAMGRRRLRA